MTKWDETYGDPDNTEFWATRVTIFGYTLPDLWASIKALFRWPCS